ncbi:peptide ABC transporter substrate-binding protein [Brachyspira hampsonii]|uniref:peptide ABC transporter substrate-binding protein n=1 Tax=Brachyspira hampsonii TaxID=1287055 RepID=UPI001C9340CC|nr:peptide ABC transporter substrate-binding protein [Brachyspira hampsonii]MBW5389143.1 peptide ABC transporter substrate-binding protein [Brachyspira hampsonii]
MKKIIYLSIIIILLLLNACKNKDLYNESIRVSIGAEPQSIDPSFLSAIDSMIYAVHVFEGLTSKDKDGNIIGGAAESWDISEDGLTITFHLRENAKWSDGKNVVADEFVYSFRRLADPKTASSYSFLISSVKNADKILKGELPIEELGVEALDDKTFAVYFESPTAYFLELAAVPIFSPLRKEVISDNWTYSPDTYIGNGPYKMIDRKPDEIISLELNTNYWNKDAIIAKRIDFVMFSDVSTAYAALKEGSILYSYKIPTADVDLLREEGYLVTTPSLGTAYYALNNTNEVLKDKRVRRALSLAIDRNYIVENITKLGEIPAAAFIPYGLKDVNGDFRENGGGYYSVKKEDYKANIEEAKKLLEEAGYTNGENFPVLEFKTNPGTGVTIAEAVQQMWKENLNIDMTITQEEWSVFQRNRQTRHYVVCRADWLGDYMDPMTFADLFVSTSAGNRVGYNNPEYDRLILEAKNTIDNKIRMANMHKAEDKLIGEDMAFIPIYHYTSSSMQSPKLKNVLVDTLEIRRFFYSYIE